jgi:hypothetical protein
MNKRGSATTAVKSRNPQSKLPNDLADIPNTVAKAKLLRVEQLTLQHSSLAFFH